MATTVRTRWRRLVEGLWFLPSLIVVGMGALSFGLLHLDDRVIGHATPWVFGGDAGAARIVLSTIAGSLITVAGLTFSITMVVLQLASSQFSPRVLPNLLADRVTQVTVGAFVGIFVFCLTGLRAVGGTSQFVPRLTVTVASALGVLAVILLIGFIHHVSTMIQVSHIAARIGRRTLSMLDVLYPRPFGEEPKEGDAGALLADWRAQGAPGEICARRPGYVQQVRLDAVADAVAGRGSRVYVAVAPGDFVSVESAAFQVWPAEVTTECQEQLLQALLVTSERNFAQDAAFGVRQLADVALRAISPGINDPTTAVTCIGYIRSVLERLAGRGLPAEIRSFPDRDVVVMARRVGFGEYLDTLVEIGRYAQGDARVVRQLLRACAGIAAASRRAGADERARAAESVAETIAEQARNEARSRHDRELVEELLARVRAASGSRQRVMA